MKTTEKELLSFKITSSVDFDADLYSSLQTIIKKYKPLHYDLMQSNMILVYFSSNIGKNYLDSFINDIGNKFQSYSEQEKKVSISLITGDYAGALVEKLNLELIELKDSELHKKENTIWRNYTDRFGVVKTHNRHIEDLLDILTLNESIHISHLQIKREKYDFLNVINYLLEMYEYCDFHKIIAYGIGFITEHLDLILLLLLKNSRYIFDQKLRTELKNITNAIRKFLNEYKLDQSRHSIYYPDRISKMNCEIIPANNAYGIKEISSFNIYLKFSEYIHSAINHYLNIKEMFLPILAEFEYSQYVFSIDNLNQEMVMYSDFANKLLRIIEIIRKITVEESAFTILKTKILGELETIKDQNNSFYKGILQFKNNISQKDCRGKIAI